MQPVVSDFVICVYMDSRLTLHWTTNKAHPWERLILFQRSLATYSSLSRDKILGNFSHPH